MKDCFTKFSFQALVFSSAALAVIGKLQFEQPWIALAVLAVLLLLRAVSRIGIYKFQSANRVNGYELHLYRSRYLAESDFGWNHHMREIGWEEAMRAWRVIQPTVFNALYQKGRFFGTKMRKDVEPTESDYGSWWRPESLLGGEDARYYMGSYVRRIFRVIHVIAFACLATLAFMVGQLAFRAIEVGASPADGESRMSGQVPEVIQALLSPQAQVVYGIVVLIVATAYVAMIVLDNRSKTTLLADEILSIHACAVLWEAVVVAHYRALSHVLFEKENKTLRGYTRELARQAKSLADDPSDIQNWIFNGGTRGAGPEVSDGRGANSSSAPT